MFSLHLFNLFWIHFNCPMLNTHYAEGAMEESKTEQATESAFKEPVISYRLCVCLCVCRQVFIAALFTIAKI